MIYEKGTVLTFLKLSSAAQAYDLWGDVLISVFRDDNEEFARYEGFDASALKWELYIDDSRKNSLFTIKKGDEGYLQMRNDSRLYGIFVSDNEITLWDTKEKQKFESTPAFIEKRNGIAFPQPDHTSADL